MATHGRRGASITVRWATGAMTALGAAALGWFTLLGPGCISTAGGGADACTIVCNNRLSHGCSSTCDCSKCADAPSSCSDSMTCGQVAMSCSALSTCPAPPADCAAFMAMVCP